jgi:hypothetical protein
MIDLELKATLRRAGEFLVEHQVSYGFRVSDAESLKNRRYSLFAVRHPESEKDLEQLFDRLRDLLALELEG